jgi:excisionase family DNA binding protein
VTEARQPRDDRGQPARLTTRRAHERLCLTLDEAAASLGLSRDGFDRYVRDELRLLRVGRRVLVPVAELKGYIDRNSACILDDFR